MEMNVRSLKAIESRTKAIIATSHGKARRFSTLAALVIAASIGSGLLLAQATQALAASGLADTRALHALALMVVNRDN